MCQFMSLLTKHFDFLDYVKIRWLLGTNGHSEARDKQVTINWVKFLHSPILHYAFSSWIEETMKKTIHCHWENRFVLQYYGVVQKF